jgi:hypothetical protein
MLRRTLTLLSALALLCGLGVTLAPSAAAADAWSAYTKCSFNATAWENVRLLIRTEANGTRRPVKMQVTGTEHIDKINRVDVAKNNVFKGTTMVNHAAPNTGAWTTGIFSPALPAQTVGGLAWQVSLHRSNGTLLASCATSKIPF